MSAKATVLALVTTMAVSQNDAAMSSRFFSEVMLDLAKLNWFVRMTIIDSSGAVPAAVQSYPENVVNLLGVFYGGHQLELAKLRELEYVNPQWRDETGEPTSYIEEGETAHTFRLYPAPIAPPTTLAFPFGEPFGRGYPDGVVVILHSETRTTLPDYLDLPVALLVIEREFERESDHQHPVFAKAAGELGRMMLALVQPKAA